MKRTRKIKAPKKFIIIEQLENMPYDYNGMHATGRRVYVPCTNKYLCEHLDVDFIMLGWDEYLNEKENRKVYGNW